MKEQVRMNRKKRKTTKKERKKDEGKRKDRVILAREEKIDFEKVKKKKEKAS